MTRVWCVRCGGVNPTEALYCGHCGVKSGVQLRTSIECNTCRSFNPQNARFCDACGARLSRPTLPTFAQIERTLESLFESSEYEPDVLSDGWDLIMLAFALDPSSPLERAGWGASQLDSLERIAFAFELDDPHVRLFNTRLSRARERASWFTRRALEDAIATWIDSSTAPRRHPLLRAFLAPTSNPARPVTAVLMHDVLVPVLDHLIERYRVSHELGDEVTSDLFREVFDRVYEDLVQGRYSEEEHSIRAHIVANVITPVLQELGYHHKPTLRQIYHQCLLALDERAPEDAHAWIICEEQGRQPCAEHVDAIARVRRELVDATLSRLHAQRYELDDNPFASGGFAHIFRAHDWALRRDIALKTIQPELVATSPHARGLFYDEILSMASVTHPNLLTIFDVGSSGLPDSRTPFISMPLLDGHDLGVYTTTLRLDRATAIDYCVQGLRGLSAMHRSGLVHCDIKPANLFVTKQTSGAHIYVMDFGIVSDSRYTIEDPEAPLFGTPAYLPPEYINTRRVSTRMDVYQMTLVLIELLLGRAIFADDLSPKQTLVEVISGAVTVPDELARDPLVEVLERGIAFHEHDRYVDANELLFAILDTR